MPICDPIKERLEIISTGLGEKAFCATHYLNTNGKVKSNKLSNPIGVQGEKDDEIFGAFSFSLRNDSVID